MKIHIVQQGDTLWNLAKKYGVDFEQLKEVNNHLSNPDVIMPGMKIKIPTAGVPVKKQVKKEAPISDSLKPKKEVQVPKKEMKAPPPKMPVAKEAPIKPLQPVQQPIIPAPQPMPAPQLHHMNMNFNIYKQKQQHTTTYQKMPAPPPKVEEVKEPKVEKPKQKPKVPVAPKKVDPCPPMQPLQPDCGYPVTPVIPGCSYTTPPAVQSYYQQLHGYPTQQMPPNYFSPVYYPQPYMQPQAPGQMAPFPGMQQPLVPQQPWANQTPVHDDTDHDDFDDVPDFPPLMQPPNQQPIQPMPPAGFSQPGYQWPQGAISPPYGDITAQPGAPVPPGHFAQPWGLPPQQNVPHPNRYIEEDEDEDDYEV